MRGVIGSGALVGGRARIVGIGAVAACLMLAGCDTNSSATSTALAPLSTEATAPAAGRGGATLPAPNLAQFRNMRPGQVEALVGEPDFRRVEPPAELWQYRSAECVVDLYLYGKGDAQHVIDEDARTRDPRRADRCGDGAQVLKERLRSGSG